MGTGTEQIHTHLLHMDRYLPQGLHCICVEQDTPLSGNGTDLCHRFYGTYLIVGAHDTDQDRIRPDGCHQLLQRYLPLPIHVQVCDLEALFLQFHAGMQHRMMLDLRSDNVFSLVTVAFCHCLYGPVVCLRSSRCKIDLLLPGSNGLGYGPSGLAHCFFPCRPTGMDRAGIAILLCKVRQHGLQDLWRHPCSSCIVQIYHMNTSIPFPQESSHVGQARIHKGNCLWYPGFPYIRHLFHI